MHCSVLSRIKNWLSLAWNLYKVLWIHVFVFTIRSDCQPMFWPNQWLGRRKTLNIIVSLLYWILVLAIVIDFSNPNWIWIGISRTLTMINRELTCCLKALTLKYSMSVVSLPFFVKFFCGMCSVHWLEARSNMDALYKNRAKCISQLHRWLTDVRAGLKCILFNILSLIMTE